MSMRILTKNLKKGIMKVCIESRDDLWTLHLVLEPNDVVHGQTMRKIKVGEEKTDVVKRTISLALRVEKVEFAKTQPVLRVLGKVRDGPEDVPRGSYHSFALEEGSVIEVEKEEWSNYQLKRIEEAAAEKKKPLLICILDREEAYLALSKRYGYDILTTLSGDVAKKEERAQSKGSFYEDVLNAVKEYARRYDVDTIILASPAFWKDELLKKITDEKLRSKIVLATCSSAKEDAIPEILMRPEVLEIVKRERFAQEMRLVEEIFVEIAKDGKVAYGKKEVSNAIQSGAIETVLVTDKYMHKLHEENKFTELDEMLRAAEKMKGDVHIISSEHQGGARLDGLGGIAAKLRYKLTSNN